MKNLSETLRNQAVEIAKEGHAGWGNTMSCAADAIEKLDAEGARGRKAIDAMGKAINCRETFLKSEMSVLGDLDMAADNFASSIHKIIEGYQQSCKEAADGS